MFLEIEQLRKNIELLNNARSELLELKQISDNRFHFSIDISLELIRLKLRETYFYLAD